MSPRRRRGGGLRGALTEDLGLKLLALGASLSIFYLVRGAEDAQRSVFVDVVVLLPDEREDEVLVSDIPERVRLTLQGTRSVLNNLQREVLGPIQMDLRDGERDYFFFESSELDLPLGVRVVQIAPASVPLRWEERVERRVPVEPVIQGRPGPGLEVAGEPSVDPDAALVVGPRSEVERMVTLPTESLDLTGLGVGLHSRRVDLEPPSTRVELRGNRTVEVTVEIAREVERRVLPLAAVALPGAPARARVRPTRVRVTLVGPPEVVAAIDPDGVIPVVDVAATPPGRRDVPMAVQVRGLPDDVEAVVEPPQVLLATPRP